MHLSERVNALWSQEFNEREIASMLGVSQSAVLFCRREWRPAAMKPAPGTEVRFATHNGGEGHMTCRTIPITLPYSGTI